MNHIYGLYDIIFHMKTTIELPDSLFQQLKKLAAERDTTLREIMESSLRETLRRFSRPKGAFRLKKATFKGGGLQEGLSESQWSEIRDRAYGDRGGKPE